MLITCENVHTALKMNSESFTQSTDLYIDGGTSLVRSNFTPVFHGAIFSRVLRTAEGLVAFQIMKTLHPAAAGPLSISLPALARYCSTIR